MRSNALMLTSPQQAHLAVNELYRDQIKPRAAAGVRMRLVCQEDDPVSRHQLRKLFHGPVLDDVSLQVQVYQPAERKWVRYTKACWKEFFRDLFCPDQSTEDLGDEEFAEFVLQSQAFAVMELGVEFTEQPQGIEL